jgi:hypothetical protein
VAEPDQTPAPFQAGFDLMDIAIPKWQKLLKNMNISDGVVTDKRYDWTDAVTKHHSTRISPTERAVSSRYFFPSPIKSIISPKGIQPKGPRLKQSMWQTTSVKNYYRPYQIFIVGIINKSGTTNNVASEMTTCSAPKSENSKTAATKTRLSTHAITGSRRVIKSSELSDNNLILSKKTSQSKRTRTSFNRRHDGFLPKSSFS